MARNFRQEARARYPWLRGNLLDRYAEEWEDSGSAAVALAELRQTDVYDNAFAGIRRDDGTLRMSENEYQATIIGYRQAFREFGMEPRATHLLRKMIEMEVSAREFYSIVQEAQERFVEPGAESGHGLKEKFVGKFLQSGSRIEALQAVRESNNYDKVFAGNRREDGTLRMDEQDYFAYQRGFRRALLSRGLNPDPFESHGKLKEAVEAEVSIDELNARLNAVEEGVTGNTQETREFFANNYGEQGSRWLRRQGTRATALAMAIDPDIGSELLSRRITAAQIGGEAQVQGYRRRVRRAENLARAGVTQADARDFYGSARQNLSGISATTERFRRGRTSLTNMEDAFLLGRGGQQQRIQRALDSEDASFSTRRDTRRTEDGRLTGLLDY